ncbi:NB-ARC domain-containing protein [Streptomyces syringium]|uniref:NB-ARC domain-containing protein n=1 Tax=Streptomyces syringium TaxID=76729 RepID=UPI003AAD1C77
MDFIGNDISGGTFTGTVIQAQNVHWGQAAPVRTPRMLLPEPEEFVDRAAPRAKLDALLAGREGRRAPRLVVITGIPGIGKTAVALRWLYDVRDDFPGGQFYADMSPQGPRSPVDPVSVLETFAGQLGTPREERPAGLAELSAYFRSLTADEPSLMLLDNVVVPAQVRPLLPGAPGSVVVVTSRNRLTGLSVTQPGPDYVTLDALDDDACAQLFGPVAEDGPDGGHEGRRDGGRDGGQALREVIRACAGLPLAVRIARVRAAEGAEALRELADELTDPQTVWEALSVADEIPYPKVLDVAYSGLDGRAAAVWRMLGAHPTGEFAGDLVKRLGGDGREGAKALRTLVHERLLEPSTAGRYRMNGLVHAYARRRLEETPPSGTPSSDTPSSDSAAHVIIDWYLERAAAAEALVSDRWRFGSRFAPGGLPTAVFENEGEALDALEPDGENAAAVVALAARTGRDRLTCELAEALRGFFFRRKYHTRWIGVCEQALEAAGRLRDDLVLARMHYETAFALYDRAGDGDNAAARHHYERARALAAGIGHARTASSALEGLGQLALREGRPHDAISLFREATTALGDIEHPRGRALLEYHRGRAHSAARDHAEAARLLLNARRLFAALTDRHDPAVPRPDRYNEARALTRYAEARLRADRPDEALAGLDEAMTLFPPGVAPKERADAVLLRGDVLAASGDPEGARREWRVALETYRGIGSVKAAAVSSRLAARDDGASADGAVGGGASTGGTSADGTAAGRTSAADPAGDGMAAGEEPTGEASADGTAADGTAVGGAAAGEASADGASADGGTGAGS